MALYVSTPVGTKPDDIERRKSLLEKTLPDYAHRGMEIWFRGSDPETSQDIRQRLESILGTNYPEKYFLTVQARRRNPKGSDDRFDPANYYDLTTSEGMENLYQNARAAKDIGARAVVVAPWIGVFRYPDNYKDEFENPTYRAERIDSAIQNAIRVSSAVRIKIALEHPTVPLYGDFNPNIDGSMFDLGFGLFEHTSQVPGEMLVLDTCHIESARNVVRRLREGRSIEDTAYVKKGNELFFVPGVVNAQIQPSVLKAVKKAKPFEIHYAGFGGNWDPHAEKPTTHIEGNVPGGENDVIGEQTFRDITKHLEQRANGEDIVIVAEPNDTDFMNPINSAETLRRIYSWLKE